ncbi:hypothetical protein [Luteipulveratus halotolerans]|uniref:Helix-turn-helix domain-containing protein n=1 Tax=Luteipulveratus halotolerans TaxID=1631356 RepID=A0A0L6CJV1_9MICO|nr:hypothetical protein [Luteipulveratus halotolerans]KNX38062.1 hypothetical protein VV01_14390 [Luteipulveratus halotolerans]
MEQLSYSPDQAARAIGKSRRLIDRAMNATDAQEAGLPLLPSKRIGNRDRLILHADLVAWLQQLPDA